MIFDFGFNLTPSVEDVKDRILEQKLANAKARIAKLSKSKAYSWEMLKFIRTELDLIQRLEARIAERESQKLKYEHQ